ncbi:MAG: pro-sigmaK processing inhibitor BofA family protein [Clostridia bacterium]|nr:pro-sigmaK processing inhibitor BofA family protein [Clostridia bacterium]
MEAILAFFASFGLLGELALGVLILFIVVKVLSLPFKLVYNGIFGAIMLWIVNLIGGFVGFSMKITIVKALIAGMFGIPGAIAVVAFELFAK